MTDRGGAATGAGTSAGTGDADVSSARPQGAPPAVPPRSPKQAWRLGLALFKSVSAHRITLVAAGMAYYAVLSLLPMLLAVLFIYGLFGNASSAVAFFRPLLDAMPTDAATVVRDQLQATVGQVDGAVSATLVAAVLIAFWSAARIVQSAVAGVRAAFVLRASEQGLVRRVLFAGITALAMLVIAVLMLVLTWLPELMALLRVPASGVQVARLVRAPLSILVGGLPLWLLYRWGPRDAVSSGRPPIWPGFTLAILVGLVSSFGFSELTDIRGHTSVAGATLNGIFALMVWLWLVGYAVLLGAELNSATLRWREWQASTAGSVPEADPAEEAAPAAPDRARSTT